MNDQETKWHSLSEVARITGINRAQLHKYLNQHRDRIPSRAFGNRVLYPDEALDVFRAIRAEGLAKRGHRSVARAGDARPDEGNRRSVNLDRIVTTTVPAGSEDESRIQALLGEIRAIERRVTALTELVSRPPTAEVQS